MNELIILVFLLGCIAFVGAGVIILEEVERTVNKIKMKRGRK
jgi:hypothetical protein